MAWARELLGAVYRRVREASCCGVGRAIDALGETAERDCRLEGEAGWTKDFFGMEMVSWGRRVDCCGEGVRAQGRAAEDEEEQAASLRRQESEQ